MVNWFQDVEAQVAKRAHIQDLIINIYNKQVSSSNAHSQSQSTEDEDVVMETTEDSCSGTQQPLKLATNTAAGSETDRSVLAAALGTRLRMEESKDDCNSQSLATASDV